MHKSVDAPPRRLRLGQWLIGLFILLSGAGLVWSLRHRPGRIRHNRAAAVAVGGGPERPPVRVVQAETRSIAVALKALGTVTPVNTVIVRSRLDGELVRVNFTEGQRVKAGQVLAEIDPRPYQVALAQAEGAARREPGPARQRPRPTSQNFQSLVRAAADPGQQLVDAGSRWSSRSRAPSSRTTRR